MIVVLVPFFLAAQVGEFGRSNFLREATYRFCVNSTAVPAVAGRNPADHDRSTRFDMSAQLKCRFRAPDSLICRMAEARAVSFSSTTVDPLVPGVPLPDSHVDHAEYQIAEEAFEVVFTPNGIGRILVNRNVSPADLNVIRAVVNQLNVGANIAEKRQLEFRHPERSVIGKCDTAYHIVKDLSSVTHNSAPVNDYDYTLVDLKSLGRRKGEIMRLEKWRNVNKCSLRSDFFLGSREVSRTDPSDYQARIVASDSTIHASDTNFASYTFNELEVARERGESLVIYESYSLALESIDRAPKGLPSAVVDPASASVYAYQYIDDEEDDSDADGEGEGDESGGGGDNNNNSNAVRRKSTKLSDIVVKRPASSSSSSSQGGRKNGDCSFAPASSR